MGLMGCNVMCIIICFGEGFGMGFVISFNVFNGFVVLKLFCIIVIFDMFLSDFVFCDISLNIMICEKVLIF